MAQNSLFFFRDFDAYDEKAAKKNLTAEAAQILSVLETTLASIDAWNAMTTHEAINAVATQFAVALGKVAQPLRVAVSGGSVSPPIDITLELLGKDRVLARLQRAQQYAAAVGV